MANILYDNCFNSSYRTIVKEVKEENGLYWHYLEETIFYVESGGMPSDQGLINQHKVLGLKKEGNKVWHLLPVKLEGKVDLAIDFHLRFHHAQNHTAQHLISGIVESVYGCNTIAHHVHDGYCDIEFDREVLNERQINELKVILNGLIRDDLPVKIFYPMEKEVPYYTSKDVSHLDEVRIVSIGKLNAQPCACIHVPSLRYLQAIAILGAERSSKGMKIQYVCGDQLLNRFDHNDSILNKVGSLLAQPAEYIEMGVLKLMQDVKNLSADNMLLKQRYIENVLSSLPEEGSVYFSFKDIDLKTFGLACRTFKQMHKDAFIFTCISQGRVQLYVKCENSNVVFKQIAEKYSLQGGGSKEFAQGGGIYEESMDAYLLQVLEEIC